MSQLNEFEPFAANACAGKQGRRRIAPRHRLAGLLLTLCAVLAGCATPGVQQQDTVDQAPRLGTDHAVMNDGYRLPLRRWGTGEDAEILLLAVHGFNDYADAFTGLGAHLATRGVLTYAYDQRGFGATAQRGRWAGTARMIADLNAVADLLRQRHPDLPLYLLGESMGGALVMAAEAASQMADGFVLVAPAVWSRETMNPLQRFALWVAANTVPWLELSGRGLGIRPSDNIAMLRAFSADPLVIRETRVEALWGITNLMDLATASAEELHRPALLLYGEHDQIIPKAAFCSMSRELPRDAPELRLVLYRSGWHMLTRDLQGQRVLADIAAWLADPDGALPSGEETRLDAPRIRRFCPPEPGASPLSAAAH